MSQGPRVAATHPARRLLTFVLAAALSFALAYLAIHFSRADQRIAAAWPLNAVFVVILLRMRRDRADAFAALYTGNVLANLVIGDAAITAFGLSAANLIEVACVVRALGLGVGHVHRVRLLRRRKLLRLAGAGACACLASMTVAAVVLRISQGAAPPPLALGVWFAADFVGLLLVAPVVWAAMEAWARRREQQQVLEAWPELALLTILSIGVFAQSVAPLLFLCTTGLVYLAFRRSTSATVAGIVLMSLIAFGLTVFGSGPVTLSDGSAQIQILVLQLFLMSNSFLGMMASASVVQRRQVEGRLQHARRAQSRRLDQLRIKNRQSEMAESLTRAGYWTIDHQARTLFWSPEVYRIHGLDSRTYEPRLETALEFYVQEDRERVAAMVTDALATGSGWTFDASIRRPNGEVRRVRCSADCTKGPDGRVTQIFGVFQDQTEALEQLESVRSQKQLLSLLADNVSDVIARYTPDGRFLYISPSIERLLGYRPDELIGQKTYAIIVPEDRESVRQSFGAGLGTGKPFSIQYRALHKDGSQLVLEAHPTPERDSDGSIISFVDSVRDVTMREARERELVQARGNAEASARVKADFLANMSHEIRTPMNGVLGFADLLAETQLNPEQDHYVSRIRSAGRSLLTVVNDILDFSKIEAGKLDIADEPFALRPIVEQVIDVQRAGRDDSDISVLVSADVPEGVSGDPDRLAQILGNLVGNGAKFGVGRPVEVRVEAVGGQLRFQVQDQGPGVDPAKLESMFAPFEQEDTTGGRKFGGTGLGLPISRALARMMDGDVTLENGQTGGAVATLTLPLKPAELGIAGEAGGDGPVTGISILVVDDSSMNRELISIALKRRGHVPVCCADAHEALELLAKNAAAFDVVFMDVQMPGMDGLEATRRIRRLPGAAATLPIVALTANVLNEQIAECYMAGMDDHLAKPLQMKELNRVLAAIAETPSGPDVVEEDPAMTALKVRYQAHMGEMAAQLRGLAQRPLTDSAPEVRALAHSIAGTAGSFGFTLASQAAFDAEAAARRVEESGEMCIPLRESVDRLIASLEECAI